MYCPNCGSKVEETDRYCEQCGAPLQTPQTVTPNTDSNTYQRNSYSTSYSSYNNGSSYGNDVKATGGLKGWLWFIIIANILGALYTIGVLFAYLGYISTEYIILFVISILLTGGVIYAATRLLSGYKYGFYMICGCAGVALMIDLLAGLYSSAVGSLLGPVILWLFLRKQWPYFK
jgi:hypothetical protein